MMLYYEVTYSFYNLEYIIVFHVKFIFLDIVL